MSSVNNKNYVHHLYSEQYAEVDKRARQAIFVAEVGLLASILGVFAVFDNESPDVLTGSLGRTAKAKHVRRTRLNAEEHFIVMGQRLFHQKYQMSKTYFCLHDGLEPRIKSTGGNRLRQCSVSNGAITKISCRGMAIRCGTGRDPADVAYHPGR